jgi:hypothetical protein
VVLDEEAPHLISGLKHATGRNVRIVLAPQPSEDPNDPLNWPVWRRELCFGILCIGGVLGGLRYFPDEVEYKYRYSRWLFQ